jgi:hypothetical protein
MDDVNEGALPEESQHNKLEELVEIGDIKLVATMNKDELNMYSITRFGEDLSLSEKAAVLKVKVVKMIQARLNKEKTEPGEKTSKTDLGETLHKSPGFEFIFNPTNRRVFEWTENLATRKDLIPCRIVDEKGKIL